MFDLIELLFGVCEIVCELSHWRFLLCLAAGLFLAFLVCGDCDNNAIRYPVTGAIVLASAVAGVQWERKSG